MYKLYGIKPPDGMFPLSFKLIYLYQREDPIITGKLNSEEYKKGSFRGGQNTIKLVTCANKIVIPQLLQKYAVKLYHTYFLHPGLDNGGDDSPTFVLACNNRRRPKGIHRM